MDAFDEVEERARNWKDRDILRRIPRQLCKPEFRFILVQPNWKRPIEKDWQTTNNYAFESLKLREHIKNGGNYGVLTGKGKLIVLDFDSFEAWEYWKDKLPKTFAVKTANKQLVHLYYFTENPENFPVKDKDGKTLLDVKGIGGQVVGAGSKITKEEYEKQEKKIWQHEDPEKYYEIYKDTEIAELPKEILEELKKQKQTKTDIKKIVEQGVQEGSRNNDLFKLACSLKNKGISKAVVLAEIQSVNNKSKNPLPQQELNTIINSTFRYKTEEKPNENNRFSIEYMQKMAEAMLNAEAGGKPRIQLPQAAVTTISDFAEEVSSAIEKIKDINIFYDPRISEIVEITTFYDNLQKKEITGIRPVDAKRLLAKLDDKIATYTTKTDNTPSFKSANEQTIKILSVSNSFIENLPVLLRFLTYPMIFINDKKELITAKKEYDEEFQSYTPEDCHIEIEEMTAEKAKAIIDDILEDFCFKEPQDKVMAIAYLLTPACRGLYKKITARTPLFMLKANRERAGKDYLAAVVGMIYEGQAVEDTPFSTGEKTEGNEELRKKITTAIKQGRRRYHSSNNKGNLNNAILEQLLTTEVWRDRELGRNKEIELNNELEISLSANSGLTYTPDLFYRARIINLFFAEEDPNSRKFKRPDLLGYVKNNRALILSAIYNLIDRWFISGQPPSSTPFTSFPEWSRVVGGIMQFHKLGNPCIKQEDDAVGGDLETKDMKELFTIMARYSLTELKSGYKISEIRGKMVYERTYEDSDVFSEWNLADDKTSWTKFGFLIKKFVGRQFKCIIEEKEYDVRLVIYSKSEKAGRTIYRFEVNQVVGLGGYGGFYQPKKVLGEEKIVGGETMPTIPTLPTDDSKNTSTEDSGITEEDVEAAE